MSVLLNTIQIFETGQERQYKAGDIIFRDGDVEVGMYGIVSGEVDVQVGGKSVETLKPGDVFGVGAIVHENHQRSSTTIAKTDCQLALMNREHFMFAVQQAPMFALEVMRHYSDRLRVVREHCH